jgi:predicted PurR-regulated permease PerM
LGALYITAEIVWPLVLAFALSLLLNPLQRLLGRLHVPRVLGAFMLVVAVLGEPVSQAVIQQPREYSALTNLYIQVYAVESQSSVRT